MVKQLIFVVDHSQQKSPNILTIILNNYNNKNTNIYIRMSQWWFATKIETVATKIADSAYKKKILLQQKRPNIKKKVLLQKRG
jgi:hypothetical protein